MEILNKLFKFSGFIAKQNAKIYASCSALGLITLKDNSPKSYLDGGRAFERLWLKVTQQNLSLQPLTGVFLLMQRIIAGQASDLSQEHINEIKNAYKKTSEIFNLNGGTIALMFRIGGGGSPSARTLRLPPDIKWLNL